MEALAAQQHAAAERTLGQASEAWRALLRVSLV